MKTSLAGHNVLVVVKSKKAALSLSEGLKILGANTFLAHDLIQGQSLQDKWDIDLVIADMTFLTALGDLVSQDPNRWTAKSAPLVFGYGKSDTRSASLTRTRGVLRVFETHMSVAKIAAGIRHFLFDPKEHIRSMADGEKVKQISLILQNAAQQWTLEAQQLSKDGLSAYVEGTLPQGETAVLTVVFPDAELTQRFAVRVEKVSEGKENVRLKVLFKEQEHWKELLSMIEARQTAIDTFLLLSSGR